MINIVNFPFNTRAVARIDDDNVVHNHIYHNCPIGKVDKNIVYNNNNFPIGRVDEDGFIHDHTQRNSPIGKVDNDGFVYKNNSLVGRIDSNINLCAGAAYLLLVYNNR
ncbi:hypothetical protein [Faecalimicrobium sp. JNUCC 81]